MTTTVELPAAVSATPVRQMRRTPVVLAVLHPKGGVGRSTTVWQLGAEFVLRSYSVRIEDLDQAKHLSSVVHRRGLLMPGLVIADSGPAD